MEYWSNGFNFRCSRFQVQEFKVESGTLNLEHLNGSSERVPRLERGV